MSQEFIEDQSLVTTFLGTSIVYGVSDPFGTPVDEVITKDNFLKEYLKLAGGTMTGAIAMGTSKITGMGDPTANQDAATKKFVDDHNWVEADISDLQSYLLNITGSPMDELSDVPAHSHVKGQILVDNATNWVIRSVGTNGQVLTADSAEADGVKWATAAGGGDALVADPLSQFAATTSAQLAGVISNETGSGLLVFGTSPTIVTPTIASLTNMQHSHLNAAGGGNITEAAISDLQSYLLSVVADTTPQLGGDLDGQGNNLDNMGVLYLTEQAEADGDIAGKGQFWVDTQTPNVAFFTDDAGTDFQLSGISPIGTQTIWAGAGAWVTRTTNGAEYVSLELATNDIMLVSFNFDTTTSEGVGLWWKPPPNWNAGTIRFRAIWTAASGSGTAIFSLGGRSFADSDAIDQALGTVQTSTDTLITANDIHISPYSSAITLAGTPVAGEPTYLEIRRDISDTLGVDAKLIGIEIEYTIDGATAT